MGHQLTVKLSDQAFAALERQASIAGTSAAALAASTLEEQMVNGSIQPRQQLTPEELRAARQRFERHFGSICVPEAVGLDNEQIDADLAREYGNDDQES